MNKRQFVSELAKLRSGATFLTLKGYRNEFSEVANYSLIFHMSYENALRRSVDLLEKRTFASDLQNQARIELLDSFNASLKRLAITPIEQIEDGYTHYMVDDVPVKGVKLHLASDTLHLYGLVVHKRVLVLGDYPNDTRKPLTKIKDDIRRVLPVGKFRQFKLIPDRVDTISVDNISLLPPV
jgi:hypothetical protein